MVKIVADTTSGLTPAICKERGIALVPQIVVFGEKSYRDDLELNTATFLKLLKDATVLPKTAAPSPSLYHPIFEEAIQKGEPVLVLAPSKKISGTVQSAFAASQDFPGADIRVIDTNTIAGDLASLVLLADRLSKEGHTADEIEQTVKNLIPRSRTYFLVDTLEYLAKGGRIGGARALLGELLQVKPILQIINGQAEPYEQERTKKRATIRLIDITTEQVKISADPHLCVMHISAEDEVKSLQEVLTTCTGISNIPVYLLPPAIVVHAGPKALAVGFFV